MTRRRSSRSSTSSTPRSTTPSERWRRRDQPQPDLEGRAGGAQGCAGLTPSAGSPSWRADPAGRWAPRSRAWVEDQRDPRGGHGRGGGDHPPGDHEKAQALHDEAEASVGDDPGGGGPLRVRRPGAGRARGARRSRRRRVPRRSGSSPTPGCCASRSSAPTSRPTSGSRRSWPSGRPRRRPSSPRRAPPTNAPGRPHGRDRRGHRGAGHRAGACVRPDGAAADRRPGRTRPRSGRRPPGSARRRSSTGPGCGPSSRRSGSGWPGPSPARRARLPSSRHRTRAPADSRHAADTARAHDGDHRGRRGPTRTQGLAGVDPWSAPGNMADLRDSGVRR